MGALQEWGIQLIQALQTLSPALDSIMELFTFLGRVEFYMIFITFLYWAIDTQLGFRVFMVLLSTDIVASSFKQLLHQPRPYWIGNVKQLSVEPSYGIPSTHASDSLSAWGYLACRVQKLWLTILAIALVLLIALSRLYLGVHFPHDIIGGWLIGLVVLFLFVKYGDKVGALLDAVGANTQILIGFLVSVAFILVSLIVSEIIAPSPDPASWASYSTEARSLTGYFTLAGALFGAAAGYALMKKYAHFQAGGTWGQRILRYVVGLVGVFIVLYGLDAIFAMIAADESVLGYILRYLRYGATTIWATFGAPWVFLKLKLAT